MQTMMYDLLNVSAKKICSWLVRLSFWLFILWATVSFFGLSSTWPGHDGHSRILAGSAVANPSFSFYLKDRCFIYFMALTQKAVMITHWRYMTLLQVLVQRSPCGLQSLLGPVWYSSGSSLWFEIRIEIQSTVKPSQDQGQWNGCFFFFPSSMIKLPLTSGLGRHDEVFLKFAEKAGNTQALQYCQELGKASQNAPGKLVLLYLTWQIESNCRELLIVKKVFSHPDSNPSKKDRYHKENHTDIDS